MALGAAYYANLLWGEKPGVAAPASAAPPPVAASSPMLVADGSRGSATAPRERNCHEVPMVLLIADQDSEPMASPPWEPRALAVADIDAPRRRDRAPRLQRRERRHYDRDHADEGERGCGTDSDGRDDRGRDSDRREFRCVECGTRERPYVTNEISTLGWFIFGVLVWVGLPLLVVFLIGVIPLGLCWIPLVTMKKPVVRCSRCRSLCQGCGNWR